MKRPCDLCKTKHAQKYYYNSKDKTMEKKKTYYRNNKDFFSEQYKTRKTKLSDLGIQGITLTEMINCTISVS